MALGRHGDDEPFLPKHADDWLGLRFVIGEALPDSLGGVVGPGGEFTAAHIADFFDLGRPEVDVKVLAAGIAEASSQDSLAESLFTHFQEDRRLDSVVGQEELRLTGRAGKAVKDVPFGDIRFLQAVGDDLLDDIIGDELAGFHVMANALADGGIVGHVPA